MLNKSQLLEQANLVDTLNILTHAYEEVSVMRMQKVRTSVVSTRSFLEILAEIFYDVKTSYRKEILKIMEQKNREGFLRHKDKKNFTFSTLVKNGKGANVLITSNARLYGDIIKRVFTTFLENAKKDPQADIVIVGKVGKDLFDSQEEIRKDYKFFEIPDTGASVDELKPVVNYLLNYEKVHVFYGQFVNLMNQDAMGSSLSGDQPMAREAQGDEKFTFFFEPSLEKVLNFFEHQVFGSLFKQTIHEGELARLASRAKAMESAIANIEKEETILKSETRKLKKHVEDKKRLEGLSGIALWT